MISKTTKDFQNEVLNKMTFKPYKTENYTIYKIYGNTNLKESSRLKKLFNKMIKLLNWV